MDFCAQNNSQACTNRILTICTIFLTCSGPRELFTSLGKRTCSLTTHVSFPNGANSSSPRQLQVTNNKIRLSQLLSLQYGGARRLLREMTASFEHKIQQIAHWIWLLWSHILKLIPLEISQPSAWQTDRESSFPTSHKSEIFQSPLKAEFPSHFPKEKADLGCI